jgi:hypothetical protein
LLALEGHAATSRFDAVPSDLADLFPAIAAVTQDAARVAEKVATVTSALSRSLLASEVVQVRNRIATSLETLAHLHAAADAQLQRINATFAGCDDATAVMLHALRVRYSYLGRWIAQLEEHRTALAMI